MDLLVAQIDSSYRTSGILTPTTRRTYSYGTDGLDRLQTDTWSNQAWRPDYRTFITRDLAGLIIEKRSEIIVDNSWSNSSRVVYAYRGAVSTNPDPDPLHFGITSWPNPTTGRATLTFTLDAASPARLSVTDALGREVAVLFDGPAAAGETAAQFDGSTLPAGVYAARLSAGGRIDTQRVTVVR